MGGGEGAFDVFHSPDLRYIDFTAVKHKYCLARDQGVKLLYMGLIASLLHPGRIIWLLFSARDIS